MTSDTLDDMFEEDDSNVEWWDHEDATGFEESLAGDMVFIIESALDQRGDAVIALPGDAAAAPVLDRLAAAKLRWKGVTIIPTDDLLVDVSDERSHVRALASRFLPLGARVLPLTGGDLAPADAGRAADARLQDVHWPLDLVWLQPGDAGEVAAIFSGPEMADALATPARAVGITTAPPPVANRVTLSGRAIRDARTLLLGFRGDAAKDAIERAMADGAQSALPVGQLLSAISQPVDIHWCA